MTLKERCKEIYRLLNEEYGEIKPMLDYSAPFELLAAVILSAQCTDERVNMVTKELFNNYSTPEDFMNADILKLEELVKSTGFYRNKAANIKKCGEIIVKNYNSKIPKEMEELIKLPGVGRKTANVVRGHLFGYPGVTVDTHVKRISNRIGITKSDNPEKIEQDVMKSVEKDKWFLFSNLIIVHGRKICKARKPLCEECIIKNFCNYGGDKK
jgi:endonuclease-3